MNGTTNQRIGDSKTSDIPLAYGYLRREEPDEAEIAQLRGHIGQYCIAHGLRMVTVFCDRGAYDTELARPGFIGLLDAVWPGAGDVVVLVPDLDHLSPDAVTREALERAIRRQGARLVVTKEANTSTAQDGAAP